MPETESRSYLSAVPPPGLVLLSILAIQLGAAVAIHLFPVLGASGTVAVRVVFSAVVLVLIARGELKSYGQLCMEHWRLLLPLGLCIFVMNFCFYHSLVRIPLGAAVTIEFIGPLGVAAFASRTPGHFFWVAIAATGIVLLSPLSGNDLDGLGVVLALMAGAGWAAFIVLAGIAGRRISGNAGLNIGLFIAAVLLIPFAVPVTGVLLSDPVLILAALFIALLSTTIPLSLEYQALRSISKRMYGILISLEPAVAALVGATLLGETVGAQGLAAIACVVTASIGITVTEKSATNNSK